MCGGVSGVVEFDLFLRVERSAIVSNSYDNLLAVNDNTHVDKMFLAVIKAVIDDIARHLLDTNSRELFQLECQSPVKFASRDEYRKTTNTAQNGKPNAIQRIPSSII